MITKKKRQLLFTKFNGITTKAIINCDKHIQDKFNTQPLSLQLTMGIRRANFFLFFLNGPKVFVFPMENNTRVSSLIFVNVENKSQPNGLLLHRYCLSPIGQAQESSGDTNQHANDFNET